MLQAAKIAPLNNFSLYRTCTLITIIISCIILGTPGFSLKGQSYPNHGLVLIDDIRETDTNDLDPNDGLHCVSDLTDCCTSGDRLLRGEFDFPLPHDCDIKHTCTNRREYLEWLLQKQSSRSYFP